MTSRYLSESEALKEHKFFSPSHKPILKKNNNENVMGEGVKI